MNPNMKQVMKNACICLGLCLALSATANAYTISQEQDKRVERHQLPNPEKDAERIAMEMKQALNLTEKQYKKVYKFYLKQQKELVEEISGKDRPENGNRPPMPPRDGNMPPRGGRPGMGGRPGGPDGPGMRPEDNDRMKERMEEEQKKMKKILSDEQYEKWIKMKAGRK